MTICEALLEKEVVPPWYFSLLPNRIWNWNFSFDKRWRLRWSCYWCVFQKLKSKLWCLRNWKMVSAISPFTCGFEGAKNFACRLTAFQRRSLINELKCQISVALILRCFWWIFIPGEAKFYFNTYIKFFSFIFDQNQLKQCKISSNLFINFFYYKNLGMPFSILILVVIHFPLPPKKLIQDTHTIFRGTLTTQATSK